MGHLRVSDADTLLGFDQLTQEFPQLGSCRRFHPSNKIISCILDALLSKKLVDPLRVSRILQENPGRIGS